MEEDLLKPQVLKMPLKIRGVPEDFYVSDKSVDSVNVAIAGKKMDVILTLLKKKSIYAWVDISSYVYSDKILSISLSRENVYINNIFKNVTVKNIYPGSLKIFVGKFVEKEVPVYVPIEGIPKKGFAVSYVKYPRTVKIKASERYIKNIVQISTIPLNVNDSSHTFSMKLSYSIEGKSIIVFPDSLEVRVVIESETTVVFKAVSIKLEYKGKRKLLLIDNKADVIVSGPKSAMVRIKKDEIEGFLRITPDTSGLYTVPAIFKLKPPLKFISSKPELFRIKVD